MQGWLLLQVASSPLIQMAESINNYGTKSIENYYTESNVKEVWSLSSSCAAEVRTEHSNYPVRGGNKAF